MPIEQWAYLWFDNEEGDFDPDHITARLGVEPTEHHRKGDPRVPRWPDRAFRRSNWSIRTAPSSDEEDWDVLIEPLLARVRDRAAEISAIKHDLSLSVGLTVVVEMDAEKEDFDDAGRYLWSVPTPPGSQLTEACLQDLARLDLPFHVSLNVMLPDEIAIVSG